MKANFDSSEYGTSYRFEITLGLLFGWVLLLAVWMAGWLPGWVPLILAPFLIINIVSRHMKGDM